MTTVTFNRESQSIQASNSSTAQIMLEWILYDESAEPNALPFSLLEEITNGFSDYLEIGRGGYGVVYMGMLNHGDVVAVKRLFFAFKNNKAFQGEVGCLIKVKHKNIIRFLGYCADTEGYMVEYNGKLVRADRQEKLLCFEYLPKGSIEHYIKDSSVELEWREWYKIIKGICEGLNYLHENNILHLDLKPANILLDKDMNPKIIDFGQSRCLEKDQTHVIDTIVAATKGYLAPEYISNKITPKFDLYSLGVIIMEILTRKKGCRVVENLFDTWSNRSDASQWKQIQVCAEIGMECIDFNPAKRPLSMKHIMDRLLETESTKITDIMPSELLVVRQFALCFLIEPKKVITCPLQLINNINRHVAFRLMDKSGESFLRLPLYGIVLPGAQYTLSVTTQECKDLPLKSNMDLILESAAILMDDYLNTFKIHPDIFFRKAKNTRNMVQEVTLKAFYTPRREKIDSSKSMLFEEGIEPKALPLSLLKEITNGFSNKLEIGRGGSAVVYKGMLDNGTTVAIKRMYSTLYDDKQFHTEVECLMKIKHKNIVRFLGYCADTKGSMLVQNGKLVMADTRERLLCFEYLPKGSLENYIKEFSGGLEWSKQYKVIKAICEGLNYLHQKNIMHLDLKPANILLDEVMMPKIIDFGNARCLEDKEMHITATEAIGSIGYMAPEFLNNYKEISYKSDIYCLGVIIIEILTRERSYGVVENVVEYWSKRSNTSQREQILVCAEIGRDCTDFIPSRRPSMRNIIDRLLVTESTQIIPGGRPSMGNVVPLKAFHTAPGDMIDLCKTSQGGGDKGEVIDHNCAHCINQTKNPVTKAVEEWMEKHPLVGRRSEMNDLHQYMTNAFFKSIQIMSVWGISGVGKSALLQNFFCEIILYDRRLIERNRHGLFNKYGWVDVAYPFNLRDFSRSLLLSFHSQSLLANKDHDIDMMESENPIVKCRGILKKHRCLIIIDDLRSTEEWDLIHAELVSGSSKNYIIVITTEGSIAKHCGGNKGELVFNVKCLHADAAFDLFKKEVCRKYPLRRTLPHGDVAEVEELVSKCGGLPKVIVEIAGLLANKSVGMIEAGACSMNDNFMDDLENSPETIDSLKGLFCWMRTYLSTCPDSLKSCILYLSIFPRGHIIRRRRLVRRWIAEGYSRDNKQHEESVEENGETQFSDLVDLSIIQQPPHMIATTKQRDDTRMMSSCQVNGFIREYIVSRQMEDDDDDNLVLELGGRSTRNTQGCRGRRHLVILQSWDRSDIIVFESIINCFSRLHSLTVFGEWRSFFISENMKLLRVLDLEDASAGGVKHEDLERMVRCLVHLKFLSLRGQREILHLPSKLGDLTKLRTLDIRGTSIVSLPESIKKLAKLQYIRAGGIPAPVPAPASSATTPNMLCKKHGHYNLVGVEVPRGIGRLKALHTLGVVNVAAPGSSKSFVQDLKKLTQLRKLGVSGINRKNSAKFFRAINGLVHLESLSVQLEKENSDQNNNDCMDDMIFLHSCSNLRSLKLYGHVSKLPRWGNGGQQLGKLAKLELEVTTLMKGDINFLGRLPQLRILRVKQLQDGELHFRDYENAMEYESYKNIKIFEIACGCSSSSLHVRFGRETMKQLELLTIDCCHGSPSSYQFSGLEHLSQLKQVLLLNTSSPDTLKQQLESQLTNHPNSLKPVVKVEEQRRSS